MSWMNLQSILMKEVSLKDYILYEPIYKIFLKKQLYSHGEQISEHGVRSRKRGRGDSVIWRDSTKEFYEGF